MLVNAIEGVVDERGMIRLREDVSLPENTRVFVIVADAQQSSAAPARIASPRLADPNAAPAFRKQVLEAPADAQL